VLAHAEEIAFHTGGPRERERCDADYARIVRLKKSIFYKRAYMSFLDTTAVKHLGKEGNTHAAATFAMPFIYTSNEHDLTRQAWDKHRENSNKSGVSLGSLLSYEIMVRKTRSSF
jgi:hypothetical protein